jgi:hypothetical protein
MMVKTFLEGRKTEMRRITLMLLVSAVVLILLMGTISAQETRDFKMTLSSVAGWPVDFGNGLEGAYVYLCAGQANLPSGSFSCSTAGYFNVEPTEGWLPHDDCPGGVKAEFLEPELTHNVRFKNGDLMWWAVDKTRESYACYYPAENSFIVHNHFQIMGGSGRFKEANGTASWELPMQYLPVGDPAAPLALIGTGYDGTVTGTVTYGP